MACSVSSLPQPNRFSTVHAFKLLYCVALIFTYPLQLFPVIRILEGKVFRWYRQCRHSRRCLPRSRHSQGCPCFPCFPGAPLEGFREGDRTGAAKAPPAVPVSVPGTVPGTVPGAADAARMAGSSWCQVWVTNSFRGFICISTAVLAVAAASDFSNFVSLIGAFCCVPLAFIYPPLIGLRILPLSLCGRASLVAALVVGLGSMAFCTWVALSTWGGSSTGSEESACNATTHRWYSSRPS